MSTSTKSFLTPSEKYDRVVVLIDMDAFYCQVEEYLDFERLKGKPIGKQNAVFSMLRVYL